MKLRDKIWLLAMVLGVIGGFMQSCTTERKAIDYMNKHPEVSSKYCGDKYPVKETYIKGKDSIITKEVFIKGDSVDCPAVVNGKDTVKVRVKCPDQKVVYNNVYRTDTVKVENTAKLAATAHHLEKMTSMYQKENILREKAEKESKTKTWWIVVLSVFFGVSVLAHLRRLLPF